MFYYIDVMPNFWRQVLDKLRYPVVASIVANCMLITAFTLLGPLPFIPLTADFTMMMIVGCLCGVGYAISNVGSFTRAQKAAQRVGFNADLDTYIMISGESYREQTFTTYYGTAALLPIVQ